MKKLILSTLSLCFFSIVHAQNPEIDRIEQKIENSVATKPDSAKIYLFQMLRYSSVLHDTVLAKTYSNIGVQFNRLGVPDSAEFYMKKALPYSEKYPLSHARMYLNLAINYRTASRYKESLESGEKALRLFKKAGNKEGEGIILGEMASNYNYMMDSAMAIKYLKQAIAILNENGNKHELSVVKQKLANVYYNNGNYTFARDLYEEVLPIFAERKGSNYYYTLLSYADCLIQLEENYKEAEKSLKEVESGLRAMNHHEIMWLSVTKLAHIYNATGREAQAQQAFRESYNGLEKLNSPRLMETSAQYLEFLNNQNQYGQALKVIERIKSTSKTLQLKMNADSEVAFLKQAVFTYGQKGMIENSLEAFERLDFLKDSLNTEINESKSVELQQTYQNDLQREKNISLEQNNHLLVANNSKKDKLILLSILSLVLILFAGLVVFLANRNKLKLQKEMVFNLEESKKLLEERNKLKLELLMEKETSLASKEKELIQVSLEMSDVQNRIEEIIEGRENPEQSEKLALQLKELLAKNNYWKYFKGKFVEVHPAFASMLTQMFPNLSENDVAFCCMLKLQLSTKEISSLMGIYASDVEAKKGNLRRKMGLDDDLLAFEKLIDHLE